MATLLAHTPKEVKVATRAHRAAPIFSTAYSPDSTQFIRPLREVQRAHVLRALELTGGNRTQAARALGISLRGLQVMVQRWQHAGSGR